MAHWGLSRQKQTNRNIGCKTTYCSNYKESNCTNNEVTNKYIIHTIVNRSKKNVDIKSDVKYVRFYISFSGAYKFFIGSPMIIF
jgi:hypothetical protein